MTQKARKADIIGTPLDLGANMRGANLGPAALRIAGLYDRLRIMGWDVRDKGDIFVPVRETISEAMKKNNHLLAIQEICKALGESVQDSLKASRIPLILGGDHSLAIGSIGGICRHYAPHAVGLIWIDAHADLNTHRTSPSGNIHGMPLSVLLGDGHPDLLALTQRQGTPQGQGAIKPENVALVGIRTLDGEEKEICRRSGIRYFTMREIDERGMRSVMEDAIATASKGTIGIHVSFDLDAVDPLYAPGVSTPVSGGISDREAHLAMEMIADTQQLLSMDLVELNPIQDREQKTAILGIEFIQSALGKSIV